MAKSIRNPGSGRRSTWEERWQAGRESDFPWHMSEIPSELPQLLADSELPGTAALDLGCGGGVATSWLAGRLQPAVGVDIAFPAIEEARSRAGEDDVHPSFVVADAAALPFRGGAFSLVFDRGCLQNLPRDLWPTYFTEVESVLPPGGFLQLYCSKATGRLPPLMSVKGMRARVAWLLGRRGHGPQFLSLALIQRLAPASLQTVRLVEMPFRSTAGRMRTMIHGVFRKVDSR